MTMSHSTPHGIPEKLLTLRDARLLENSQIIEQINKLPEILKQLVLGVRRRIVGEHQQKKIIEDSTALGMAHLRARFEGLSEGIKLTFGGSLALTKAYAATAQDWARDNNAGEYLQPSDRSGLEVLERMIIALEEEDKQRANSAHGKGASEVHQEN